MACCCAWAFRDSYCRWFPSWSPLRRAEISCAGWRAAASEWIAILNSDLELAPDWAERLLAGAGEAGFATGLILNAANRNAIDGTYDLVGPSGAFPFNTRPVRPGETLILYGVGFGPASPRVPAGRAFSGAATADDTVTITIGGVQATILFAGITEAGLYQFNLSVPVTGSGDQPLEAYIDGVRTPQGPVVTVQ